MNSQAIAAACLVVVAVMLVGCLSPTERADWQRKMREARRRRAEAFCRNPTSESVKRAAIETIGVGFPLSITVAPTLTTFGVTVGATTATFKCKNGRPRDTSQFLLLNHDRLLADVSRGRGEYLASLEALLKLSPQQAGRFRADLRAGMAGLVQQDAAGFADTVFATANRIKREGAAPL